MGRFLQSLVEQEEEEEERRRRGCDESAPVCLPRIVIIKDREKGKSGRNKKGASRWRNTKREEFEKMVGKEID